MISNCIVGINNNVKSSNININFESGGIQLKIESQGFICDYIKPVTLPQYAPFAIIQDFKMQNNRQLTFDFLASNDMLGVLLLLFHFSFTFCSFLFTIIRILNIK